MNASIDYISVNDIFWLQFKPHLVSFGFDGLLKDIHFTIGFDERSPDLNLHITKNVRDSTNKPKIKIFCINKVHLEEIFPSLSLAILNKLLKPIDLEALQRKYDYDLGFMSFDDLKHSENYSLIEQKLIDSFNGISRIKRKTRLKIEGDIGQRLELYSASEDLQSSILDNISEFATEYKNPIEGGIIISKDSILQAIRVNDKWFTFQIDLKLFDLLTAFMDPQLTTHLIWKIKRALVQIKSAETYADTKEFDNPIRLVRHDNIKHNI